MKKHLIAAAVVSAFAAPAMAQNVSVYGVIDNAVGTFSGVGASNKSISGVFTGGMATSRLGFQGSEDLGGGLKVDFVLEMENLTDTGDTAGVTTTTTNASGTATIVIGSTGSTGVFTAATNTITAVTTTQATATSTSTNNLFSRAAFVRLSGAFGNVSVGRQNTDSYNNAAKFDPMTGGNVGTMLFTQSATGNIGDAYATARLNNGVRYESPSFNGLKVSYHHGFGESGTGAAASRTTDMTVSYSNGPLQVAVGAQKENDTDGVWDQKSNYLAAMYTIGSVTITGGQFKSDDNDATGKATRNFIGGAYDLGAGLVARAGYITFKDDAISGSKAKITALRIEKAMSKRTTAYGIYAHVDNGTGTSVNLGSTSKMDEAAVSNTNQDQTAIMVGIRHSF